jgi:hypothetical protein
VVFKAGLEVVEVARMPRDWKNGDLFPQLEFTTESSMEKVVLF